MKNTKTLNQPKTSSKAHIAAYLLMILAMAERGDSRKPDSKSQQN